MVRAALVVPVAVPLVALALASGANRTPTSEPPPAPPAIATESIRGMREDANTFRRRWPEIEMPRQSAPSPATRTLPKTSMPGPSFVRKDERSAVPTPTADAPSRPRRHRLRIRTVRLDICAQHGMRKQITNGGRSWRCRK